MGVWSSVMTPELDIALLRAFVHVVDVGSISGAAKQLHLTQSAASLQIRRLEDRAGTALFRRGSRGVTLTASGEALLPYARRMLALEGEALSAVRGTRIAGDLRFGTNEQYAKRYLPDILHRFRAVHPDAHPEIVCDVSTRILERFEDGELDACLVVQHDETSPGEVVGQEELVWVASPELSLAEDRPIPLALFPSDCIFRAHGIRALAEQGRPWRLVFTSQSEAAIDIALAQRLALTIRARRTLDRRWRIFGEAEGMPALAPVSIEMRRAAGSHDRLVGDFTRLVKGAVGRG